MTLRNTQHPERAIEVWDGPHQVATIHTTLDGLHIVCEPGTDAHLSITREDPPSIHVRLDTNRQAGAPTAEQSTPDARD